MPTGLVELMAAYQSLYRDLFRLIMGGQACSPEADDLRTRMNQMPGKHSEKLAWGVAVGRGLYEEAIR